VVNVLGQPIHAEIDGRSLELPGYGVHWLRR
jgi:hypothetical protein